MHFRKLQKIGGTYLVSLPKEWAERRGLTKGTQVAIVEREDGRILVDPQYNHENRIETAVISPSDFFEREITGKYLLGFDMIEVAGDTRLSPEVSEKVRKNVRRLIGLEIVEEDAYKIVLQCLLEPSALSPEKIMRREHLLASSMHRDVLMAFKEGDVPLAKSIIERDEEVDRLYFLLVRLLRMIILQPGLNEKFGISLIDCLDYRLVANYIEAIADYSHDIAKNVIEFSGVSLPERILQKLSELGRLSYNMHQEAFKALLSKNLDLIGSVLSKGERSNQIIREVEGSLADRLLEEISYTSSVASALTKICDYSVDMADLVMV